MCSKLLLPVSAAALLLTACETTDPVSGSPDASFGEATKWNKAAMIIDPDPVYPEGAAEPGASGAKGAAAVKRYRTDAVKEVEQISSASGPQ